MRPWLLSLLLVHTTWVSALALHAGDSATRPNVLFIAIDDLNHWVGYTGRNKQAQTPNIDRLSRMGVSFTNAHCASPSCNPSRAALMSGIRASSSGCYLNNQDWKQFIPEGKGLANTFKQSGYSTLGAGKIYHNNTYYPGEWTEYFKDKSTRNGSDSIGEDEGFKLPVTHDIKDSDINDWYTSNYCIEQLGKARDKPFFLACGLHKPHLPWVVPKKYYDQFPLESIELPPYLGNDLDDLPPSGVKMANPKQDHEVILASARWKLAIQSYLASCAYTDMNVGRVLDALEKSPHKNNTIIVLWGDHGWHLGEKHHWRKFTLWEEATRAPLIWVAPGVTTPNTICARTVDFMSIYPTLCALTGIEKPAHVIGEDTTPLLRNAKAAWSVPALCTYGFQNHAVRSEQWRYIRYANSDEELYDEIADPYEWTNVAGKPEHAVIKAELAHFFPTENKPHVKSAKEAKDDN